MVLPQVELRDSWRLRYPTDRPCPACGISMWYCGFHWNHQHTAPDEDAMYVSRPSHVYICPDCHTVEHDVVEREGFEDAAERDIPPRGPA